MSKQYRYAGIWVEITRRCNMSCDHCSCGEAQNLDISTEIIDRIFAEAKDCDELALTGGEPFLRLNMIEYLVDKIEKHQWQTKRLQVTTNGSIQDARIIDLLLRFCRIREGNHVFLRISTDEFHNIVSSARALSFYWELCQTIPEITVIPAEELRTIHMRGKARLLMETHPELAEKYYVNEVNSNPDHRIRIIDDKVICGICVHANGNVGLAEQINYDDADAGAFGNIITGNLAELLDKHNDMCLVTCDELQEYTIRNAKWSWKYIGTQFKHNDIVPNRIIGNYRVGIFDVVFALREEAHELYPYVSAQDIMDMITFDSVREVLDARIPALSCYEMEKHIDRGVLGEINELCESLTPDGTENQRMRISLIATVYSTMDLEKGVSIEELPQLKKLKELNEQYQLGQRTWRNDKVYFCDEDRLE